MQDAQALAQTPKYERTQIANIYCKQGNQELGDSAKRKFVFPPTACGSLQTPRKPNRRFNYKRLASGPLRSGK